MDADVQTSKMLPASPARRFEQTAREGPRAATKKTKPVAQEYYDTWRRLRFLDAAYTNSFLG